MNLFVSEYKPKTLADFLCQKSMASQNFILRTLLEIDDLNVLFIGNPCSGKTTLLNIMVREYYGLGPSGVVPETNILYINNLKEQGIGFFRGEMKAFCQASCTIFGKKKMVIIDDIDLINEQSQQVFRNYIDKYKHNIHFVSVCTNVQKVIESFQSRVHIIKIESPSKEQIIQLYDRVVIDHKLCITEDARHFLFQYCDGNIRNFMNHLEKIFILDRPVNLEICMKLCTDISFSKFEQYILALREGKLSLAIRMMFDIYDYGYSVVDIYDYFYTFVKATELLKEDEKYRILPFLCEYLTIFHSVHEDCIELALFTNRVTECLLDQ